MKAQDKSAHLAASSANSSWGATVRTCCPLPAISPQGTATQLPLQRRRPRQPCQHAQRKADAIACFPEIL
eukprot:CAMPEP_0170160224 /NCGR_PEP_ID=MMETSP0033_2-20121228/72950_1 /TAXON_ID=195969 /ORGANISM="Dolichomastix tenuilepis, Strain CCMP3274" /LENGTH=69 /DNA_ID=CAMNT_0010397759 /DNA_START=103 /DNA_END=309 /DNA_ORIENTATION=-